MGFFTLMMIFVILLGASIPVSQIIQLLRDKDSDNVPVWGYIISVCVNIVWFMYGLQRKDPFLIFSSIVGMSTSSTVIFLVMKYRRE